MTDEAESIPDPGIEVTVGFSPKEGRMVKYAIRQRADADVSPVEDARRLLNHLRQDKEWVSMPDMTDEVRENPKSGEELLALFDHNRVTMTLSVNQQLQLILLSFLAEMSALGDLDRLEGAYEMSEGALRKLRQAADDIFEQMDDDEFEAMMDVVGEREMTRFEDEGVLPE